MAADKANWSAPLPEGSGRGIAIHEAFGSITAQVAEVTWKPAGGIAINRIVCVVDCGEVVNPDTVQAQLQGGVLYGLSAALYGDITISDGRVLQSNFNDYRVVKLADAPRVETHVIRSGAPMGGIGEPGTPAAAPAVANAVFAATGQRLRDMPFNLDKFPARTPKNFTSNV
jgi:isoquinoline 1-oxidoreductase beta subunit